MRTAPRWSSRSSSPSRLAALLCCTAFAAGAEGEVRGRLVGDRPGPAVVYAADLPEEAAPKDARATLRQLHLAFVPKILPVLAGTTVEFLNEDSTAHNVFSPSGPEAFDLGTFGNGARTHVFKTPGAHVILCNVHLEMVAWVLVLKTPRFASVDEGGHFVLKLPAGRHRLVVWRPRQQEREREIEVAEGGTSELEWDPSRAAR